LREVKYVIAGGGVGALHAAKRIRRGDADGSVLMVSDDVLPPYDLPPLSKDYMRGKKTDADIVYEPLEKLAELKIEVLLQTRVEKLDAKAHVMHLSSGEDIHYEKAVIATGARPIKLPIPGADLPHVHYLRNVSDSRAIAAEAGPGKRAAIIGGGFIGLETAASLTEMGVTATVIEALPHIWARVADRELAEFVMGYCTARGVTFRTDALVTEIKGSDQPEKVVLKSGEEIECDFVCIGIGIHPNVELARDAGLEIDSDTRGIKVNDHMQTSDPDIYAVGDVISYPDPMVGQYRRVEHWGHAEYSGQVAGMNAAGGDMAYDFLSYVWSDIFDLHIEAAGDESRRDQTITRPGKAANAFTLLHLNSGALTAYFAVNGEPREFTTYRRLIRSKKDLRSDIHRLEDPDFNVRELAATA
jgi:3-phenylpropionate/trans-cinnamate dioxygenase ferredoxin reductase subunit